MAASGLLFVDDDPTNARQVEQAFPGARVVHVRPGRDRKGGGGGMGDDEFQAVRDWLAQTSLPGERHDPIGPRAIKHAASEPEFEPEFEPEPESSGAYQVNGQTQGDHLMLVKMRRQSLGGAKPPL